jgi:hypothetical protein
MKLAAMTITAALVGGTGAVSSAGAEPLPFEELVRQTDLIAMGQVSALRRAADGLLVEFAVERLVKGGSIREGAAAKLEFVAPEHWSEPRFSKQEGRRLLVFLKHRAGAASGGRVASVEKAPWILFRISDDRLAYFEVSTSTGSEQVVVWSDDLTLPPDVPVREIEIAPGFIASASLRPLLAAVERFLAPAAAEFERDLP